jgi:hypothetical protein
MKMARLIEGRRDVPTKYLIVPENLCRKCSSLVWLDGELFRVHADDVNVSKAIDLLGKDPTVMNKVQHHNPWFGYNTAPGYIEEDSVQALEAIVSERFGVAHNPCKYWQEQDDGMHVLAAALYVGYKRAQAERPQTYSSWLTAAVESGQLRGSALKQTVQSFFVSPDCH